MIDIYNRWPCEVFFFSGGIAHESPNCSTFSIQNNLNSQLQKKKTHTQYVRLATVSFIGIVLTHHNWQRNRSNKFPNAKQIIRMCARTFRERFSFEIFAATLAINSFDQTLHFAEFLKSKFHKAKEWVRAWITCAISGCELMQLYNVDTISQLIKEQKKKNSKKKITHSRRNDNEIRE